MTFEAGTWCTLRTANTVREDHQLRDRRHCYDPLRIYYGDRFISCYVRGMYICILESLHVMDTLLL